MMTPFSSRYVGRAAAEGTGIDPTRCRSTMATDSRTSAAPATMCTMLVTGVSGSFAATASTGSATM